MNIQPPHRAMIAYAEALRAHTVAELDHEIRSIARKLKELQEIRRLACGEPLGELDRPHTRRTELEP